LEQLLIFGALPLFQKDKGQDTRNQLHQLREVAAKQEWTITHEYIDHVSGKSSNNRP
jgi:DNA invertase Pin-like site-specific DNA recombinase